MTPVITDARDARARRPQHTKRTPPPRHEPKVPISHVTLEHHLNEQLPLGAKLEIAAKGERAPEVQVLSVTPVGGAEALWSYVVIWREDAK